MTDMIIATTLERDQEQFANQIIASKGENLPATIEEIIPVLAFSKAKMTAFKALSDAAKQVDDQNQLNEAALASGQRWGIVHLYGQKKLGEITREMTGNVGRQSIEEGPSITRSEKLVSAGISENGDRARARASEAERIAANPDILDRVVEEAEEKGGIPTKAEVIREIKKSDEKKRKAKAVAEGRTAKPELQLRAEEQLYILALESIISKLPKQPPKDWSEAGLKLAKGYADIIITRLEVFNE